MYWRVENAAAALRGRSAAAARPNHSKHFRYAYQPSLPHMCPYSSPLQDLQNSKKCKFYPSNAYSYNPKSAFCGHYSHFLLQTHSEHFQCASQTTLAHMSPYKSPLKGLANIEKSSFLTPTRTRSQPQPSSF